MPITTIPILRHVQRRLRGFASSLSPHIGAIRRLHIFALTFAISTAATAFAQTNLTGTWAATDGGIYYFRQVGNQVWWAGFSSEYTSGIGDLHKGLLFTDLFQGTLSGNTLTGNFIDVPKGQMLTYGPLTLTINGNEIESWVAPGAYRAVSWERVNWNIPQLDVFTLFDLVKKNQNEFRDHSLLDNLKPVKSKAVSMFGTIYTPSNDPYTVKLAYPISNYRSYDNFICLDHNDSPPDGDLTFDMHVDRANLDQQIGFWSDDWETSHNITATEFQNKLNDTNMIHGEIIMYGGTTECEGEGAPLTPYIAPGWQQTGTLSTLLNGVPIDGQVRYQGPLDKDGLSNQLLSILGVPLGAGSYVRLTGILVLDCGHGWWHNCHESQPQYQNQEIHPIYSIDVIQDFTAPRPYANLTGAWAANDGGTYYVRQIGNTVWWLGLSADEGQTFANVFQGTLQSSPCHLIQNNEHALRKSPSAQGGTQPVPVAGQNCSMITGNWADIPLGQTSNAGTLFVDANNGQFSTLFDQLSETGGFGGANWQKLYDAGNRQIVIALDQAEVEAPFWPKTSQSLDIQVGPTRLSVKPSNARRVKLPDGKEVMQADISSRITIDAPEIGTLRMSAQFVGYRASWNLSESDYTSGARLQTMTPPRALHLDAAQTEEEQAGMKKQEGEAAKKALPSEGAMSSPPIITLHYHIEPADPSRHDRLPKSTASK
jgi:hypothetical protein